mmetsp:Transcript_59/g.106  ORF Transcript_59/g.106 Transcript_59/m.106 type:complete len:116 (-) Transcript_59:1491-1838(-)
MCSILVGFWFGQQIAKYNETKKANERQEKELDEKLDELRKVNKMWDEYRKEVEKQKEAGEERIWWDEFKLKREQEQEQEREQKQKREQEQKREIQQIKNKKRSEEVWVYVLNKIN